jgi:acetoacetyl-CoA synthetase
VTNEEQGKEYKLDKLRIVTSTGSVLSRDMYEWFYYTGFPPKTHLISMSGGTDIAGSCMWLSLHLPRALYSDLA